VNEGLAFVHSVELGRKTFEKALDGRRVRNQSRGHGEALMRDVTDGNVDVVRDPLDKKNQNSCFECLPFVGRHPS